ncbi:MAG: hypothetical protein EOP62_21640 [Sphingomonadales bacterium]|nr:MAG: hypothetical protein EOP62_21640 [Sphingomonadales bacterium]
MTSPKKSETIELRLPFAAKLAFAERCRAEGITMSAAIRRFVEAPQRRWLGAAVPVMMAVTGAIVLGVLFSPFGRTPDYGAGFEALDRNEDGVVTRAEVPGGGVACQWPLALPHKRGWLDSGPRVFSVCLDEPDFATLDCDGNGLATRQEFAAHRLDLLRRGYDVLDRDGSGSLDSAEYAAASKIGLRGTPPELARFRDLDSNGDRRVEFAEYLR